MGLSLGRRPFTDRRPGERLRLTLPDGRIFFVAIYLPPNGRDHEPRIFFDEAPRDVIIEREEIPTRFKPGDAAATVVTPDTWK